MLSEQMSRSRLGKGTPELGSNYPVCGHPYRPGDAVLALVGLSFARSAVPSSPAAVSCDTGSQVVLGHHGCVLPRLLTLLASFQPEARFVTASNEDPTGERFSPACYPVAS